VFFRNWAATLRNSTRHGQCRRKGGTFSAAAPESAPSGRRALSWAHIAQDIRLYRKYGPSVLRDLVAHREESL
jgi:hypothetical protein